jgi:hypothetical protein
MTKQPAFKLSTVIVVLLLVVALVGAMFLTKSNQNTQRGAYFSGAKLLVLPPTITASVGEAVPVQLWVQTDMITGGSEPAKVSSVDTIFCYGNGLQLASTPTDSIDLNKDAFASLEYVKDQDGCLRIVAVSSGIAPEDLKSGLVRVASVRFKAVNPGTGTVALNMDKSVVAGYNPLPGSTDMTMKMGSVENANYNIGGIVTGGPTSFGSKILNFFKSIFHL